MILVKKFEGEKNDLTRPSLRSESIKFLVSKLNRYYFYEDRYNISETQYDGHLHDMTRGNCKFYHVGCTRSVHRYDGSYWVFSFPV